MFDAPSLLAQIGDAARAEAQAAAARLLAIGDLFRLRLAQHGDRAQWAADTSDAVAAEIAATLGTSVAMGHSNLRYARAMHERLPGVAAVFRAGDIDFRLFRTIVFRTDLIVDAEALAAADAQLAIKAPRWPSMTSWKLATEIDRIVTRIDRDAVRRSREYAADRYFQVTEMDPGMSLINGTVFATTGQALDRRLDELANTVCDDDPRTIGQLRADALGALAAGGERLTCGCERADCPVGSAPRQPNSVVIHMVADSATVDGSGAAPGFLYGDGIIPAEIVRELTKSAKLQPITTPTTPESGYLPSRALTDFVRARDLTCRAVWRRRCHPPVEPQVPVPKTSPAQDFLGLARPTTARRHHHLETARRAHPRHHTRQRFALPRPVRQRGPAAGREDAGHAVRRPRSDDADSDPHPRAEPRRSHRRRTPAKPRSTDGTQESLGCHAAGHPTRCRTTALLGDATHKLSRTDEGSNSAKLTT
jgi:hypothetical protein